MKVRHAIRHAADLAACLSGHLRRRERRAAGGFTVLMYHRVLPDEVYGTYPQPGLAVPRSAFEAQVDWLRRRTTVRTVAEALAGPAPANGRERPAVCLTFDDGYRDNHEIVAPVLEAAGLRGSFYVTVDPVEHGTLLWFDEAVLAWRKHGRERVERTFRDVTGEEARFPGAGRWSKRLAEIGPEPRAGVLAELRPGSDYEGRDAFALMTPERVRDLHDRGHEVGSHTLTHPRLTTLADEDLSRELTESASRISSWLGTEVSGFCYPQGDHDDRVVEAVRRGGYDYALTTEAGANAPGQERLRLHRRGIKTTRTHGWNGRSSVLAFRCEVNGFHGWLSGREGGERPVAAGEKR